MNNKNIEEMIKQCIDELDDINSIKKVTGSTSSMATGISITAMFPKLSKEAIRCPISASVNFPLKASFKLRGCFCFLDIITL